MYLFVGGSANLKKTYLSNPRRLMSAADVWMPSASSNIGIQTSSADVQLLACSNIGIQNYTGAYSTSYRLPMFECLLMFEWMFQTSAFKSWMPTIEFTPMCETFIQTLAGIQTLAADIWTALPMNLYDYTLPMSCTLRMLTNELYTFISKTQKPTTII